MALRQKDDSAVPKDVDCFLQMSIEIAIAVIQLTSIYLERP